MTETLAPESKAPLDTPWVLAHPKEARQIWETSTIGRQLAAALVAAGADHAAVDKILQITVVVGMFALEFDAKIVGLDDPGQVRSNPSRVVGVPLMIPDRCQQQSAEQVLGRPGTSESGDRASKRLIGAEVAQLTLRMLSADSHHSGDVLRHQVRLMWQFVVELRYDRGNCALKMGGASKL